MKATVFGTLKSAVQSLQDCTKLNIECGRIGFTLDGRASPFVSHRAVEYYSIGGGDELRPGTRFSGNYDLIIGVSAADFHPGDAGPPSRDGLETVWEVTTVPMSFVRKLILLACEYGVDNYAVDINDPLVTVAVAVPRLFGWTEYDPDPEISRRPVFMACEGELTGHFVSRALAGGWLPVQNAGGNVFAFLPCIVNLAPFGLEDNPDWGHVGVKIDT